MSDLLQQRQHEIAEEFEFFEGWMERYEHIIELGKELALAASESLASGNVQGKDASTSAAILRARELGAG